MKTKHEAQHLAQEFRETIARWLSAEQRKEIDRRNRGAYKDTGCCATHDFCDANMAMLEAAQKLQIDDSEYEIWNLAWDIARSKGFSNV